MTKTASPLSRLEMIISLKTIQYLLETCKPLLSDYENELARDFVISVAANMVRSQEDRIIISLCSDSKDAITEQHELVELYAVINALHCRRPGDEGTYNSGHSSRHPLRILQDMSAKNGQEHQTQKEDTPPLPVCHSDRELD